MSPILIWNYLTNLVDIQFIKPDFDEKVISLLKYQNQILDELIKQYKSI